MISTQVQLTEAQAHALETIAKRDGVSLSEVVRRCVDAKLAEVRGRRERYARAQAFVGVLDRDDAPEDLADAHDTYLGTDFGEEEPR